MSELPAGTVTFLFTDVEGSTRLLDELGEERYAHELEEHRRVVRAAIGLHGGTEVDTQGDAFFVAFPTASGALAAAADVQEALRGPVRVRIGIHSGEPLVAGDGYVGLAVHRAARIAAAGHGGQVLVSEATRALVEDDWVLVDLGPHRLRDLAGPQRIYQVGSNEFPLLHTLDRTNLPVPTTEFLGRREELARLARLLLDPVHRLVTLVGPGGAGKSRLAVQAAADAVDAFPGGVTWVPLASLEDAGLVLPAVAEAVGVRPEGRRPLEALSRWTPVGRALLLLDNLEHVTAAAADVAELLARCPAVTILATSREPLRVRGEHVVRVGPLAEVDAVALFTARARAADPDFVRTPAVERLCDRLDRLPLALELAAARSRALSIETLLDRLDRALDLLEGGPDTDPRHRTLRATIAWSHELLDERERTLFRRFGGFAGSCTIEALEEICDADVELVTSLVDKSLVRRRVEGAEDRYWMLETIRAFSIEQLAASGERDVVLDRHAEWYARRAIALGGAALQTMGSPTDAIGRDVAELRHAFSRLLDSGADDELLADAVAHVACHWYFVADPSECVAWLRAGLDRVAGGPLRGRLEVSLAMLELYFDAESASGRARRSLELLDDPLWRAFAWTTLGNAVQVSDAAAATAAYETALEIAEAAGAGGWTSGLTSNLAGAAAFAGDFERAEQLARRLMLLQGDPVGRVSAHTTLAYVYARQGDVARAREAGREALRLARVHAPVWVASIVLRLAWVDAVDGRLVPAAVLEAAATAQIRLSGWEDAIDPDAEELRRAVEAGLTPDERERARTAGSALTIEQAAAIALGERDLPSLSG